MVKLLGEAYGYRFKMREMRGEKKIQSVEIIIDHENPRSINPQCSCLTDLFRAKTAEIVR